MTNKPIQQTLSLPMAMKLFESGLPVWKTEYVWVYAPDDLSYTEREIGAPPEPKWYIFRDDDPLKPLYVKKHGRWYPAPTADELGEYLLSRKHALLTFSN